LTIDVRLLDELAPDPLHVLVALDHFGIIIIWAGEGDVVLGRELACGSDLLERELVAGHVSAETTV
jgi:hypothetical protein